MKSSLASIFGFSSWCFTSELQRGGEGQNGDVSAVVVHIGVDEGQVAAVVDHSLHLSDDHVLMSRVIVDGAQQDPPPPHMTVAPKKRGH